MSCSLSQQEVIKGRLTRRACGRIWTVSRSVELKRSRFPISRISPFLLTAISPQVMYLVRKSPPKMDYFLELSFAQDFQVLVPFAQNGNHIGYRRRRSKSAFISNFSYCRCSGTGEQVLHNDFLNAVIPENFIADELDIIPALKEVLRKAADISFQRISQYLANAMLGV